MKTVDVAGSALSAEGTHAPALQRLAESLAGHCDSAILVAFLSHARLLGYSVVVATLGDAGAIAGLAEERAAALGASEVIALEAGSAAESRKLLREVLARSARISGLPSDPESRGR